MAKTSTKTFLPQKGTRGAKPGHPEEGSEASRIEHGLLINFGSLILEVRKYVLPSLV